MIKFLEVKRAYYADPKNVVVQWRMVGDIGDNNWIHVIGEPCWDSDKEYRIRPRTIRIGDIDVPEPVRDRLIVHSDYWVANTATRGMNTYSCWNDDDSDNMWLSRGLIHLTKEAAIEHAKALIIVSGGKV